MIFSHVVCASENHMIGKGGIMPWHLKEDLRRFKQITTGHCIIMGRKTFDSIGKALPNRLSVVVSRTMPDSSSSEVVVVRDLNEAMQTCEKVAQTWGNEAFIVGGGEIYRQSMMLVDKIYLTIIKREIDGDTSYPRINFDQFAEIERSEHDGELPYTFLTYQRKVLQ